MRPVARVEGFHHGEGILAVDAVTDRQDAVDFVGGQRAVAVAIDAGLDVHATG